MCEAFQFGKRSRHAFGKERNRIESVGGHFYYANKVKKHGKEVELKEENYGKGFTFPYRVIPGKIAVSLYIFLKI